MTDLRKAAAAVLARWDSPQWEWTKHGPTADLMAELRAALAAPVVNQQLTTDAGRVIEWATSRPRKSAVLAFTDGPERQAAYWIEWAESRVKTAALAERPQPVAWYLPAEGGDDSKFRDHRTVLACTGNKWEGWLPLYAAPPTREPVRLTTQESPHDD